MVLRIAICSVIILSATTAYADECSFHLVQSTLGETANLYLEQRTASEAVQKTKDPTDVFIVIPRGVAASTRRAMDRHRLATSVCSGDAKDFAEAVVGWLDLFRATFALQSEIGKKVLLREVDPNKVLIDLAEIRASLDETWKELPQIVLAISLTTVGQHPTNRSQTALKLSSAQKQELLAEIKEGCSRLGGCPDKVPTGGSVPVAVAAHMLMRDHLVKPWPLDGIPFSK